MSAKKASVFATNLNQAAADAIAITFGTTAQADAARARMAKATAADRRARRLAELRENKRTRYEWARRQLLDAGEDPTDARIGEKLGYDPSDPGRTIRRWRQTGIID